MESINEEQEGVMNILVPFIHRLCPIFSSAMTMYNDEYPSLVRAQHESRTRANCVYDHAWMGLESEFILDEGFHFLDIRGLKILNIRDELVIRVKKVDANGYHRNYPTAQQKAFDKQEELPGLPTEATRIVLGYQPDIAFSEVERVIVRDPIKKWASQIIEGEAKASWIDITPIELPFREAKRKKSR
ncbi:MAG: hypothetical protein COA81_03310 [Alphaproteobacteria bacterium]|nr:MAG: hypothetical protein COA81_03310 [Alphaproteobacteria bacterium]